MTVSDSAMDERAAYAGYRCEAHGLHAPSCPGEVTPETRPGFVLHHTYRRQDVNVIGFENRDDVEHLRFVFNGASRLGLGACHQEIHRNQPKARTLGLLVDKSFANTTQE